MTLINKKNEVNSCEIGHGTKIWQYSVVHPTVKIGVDCEIGPYVLIGENTIIGNNVKIKNGVQILAATQVENDVFIDSNVTFTTENDHSNQKINKNMIGKGVSIGANVSILEGVKIESYAKICTGAVVKKNVPAYAIISGNPGKIIGYVGASIYSSDYYSLNSKQDKLSTVDVGIGGCTLNYLPLISDVRGSLSFVEYGNKLSFIPKRFFWVFDVPSSEIRGEHAHKKLHQYIMCIKGSINVVIDDGCNRKEIILDKPNIGLYMPPLVWGIQYKYSHDAVLFVLASDNYDSADYLRNYEEFLNYVTEKANK